ncbi:MAG: peptidoglycan DD-metalloendopeptidase family protein [Desulfobacterales bacterium]|nr:peptidoglycan DD-metalloendopeptidase family protein [Desulfobacterales bacterium]
MQNNISFLILSDGRTPVKQFSTSRKIICISCIAILLIMGASCYIGYDYFNLKSGSIQNQNLQARMESQSEEIEIQRRQISRFAEEINGLQNRLIELNDFENKILMIANIEKPDKNESLFGVGGSSPEDLDTTLSLSEKHNSLIREMHERVDQLELASINQADHFDKLMSVLEEQRNMLAATPSIHPLNSIGWISSKFGYRVSPFTGKREFHRGLDIAAHKGTPVISVADGVVTFAGNKGLLGKVVKVDHGYGFTTVYAHLDKTLVNAGDAVKRGDTVGKVGNTGRSTGSHLHYSVNLNGVSVNPEKYILD